MLAILVLDGLNAPLLDRLIAEGRMPALERLLGSGRRIELAGSAGHLEGSVHTTLHTGLEASAHGVYSPFQWSAAAQRVRLRDAFEVPPAVWDRLRRAGRRSLLIDPYDSVPPRELLGAGLRGWQFTNRVALPPWSSPSVDRRLRRRFGRPRSADEIYGRPTPEELLRLREVLLEAPARIAGAAEEMLGSEGFDLVWIDFAAMHLAGHQFLDVDAVLRTEGVDRSELERLHTAMADVYEEGDRAIGRVLERLPAGTDLIVAAPSSMVAERDRSDMLPAMVSAVLDGRGEEPEPGRLELWSVRASVPSSLRRWVARLIPDRVALGLTTRMLTAGTDWSRTRAFAVPNDPGGGLRLNLRGRERQGIVDPSDAGELTEELVAGLMSFADPDGAPAIEAVERVSELEAPGPAAQLLPDLVIRWRRRAAAGVRSMHSPRFGTVTRRGIGSGRSGNHTGDAWAILAPGRSRPRELGRPARIVDVAATACALLDVDREGLAGEPLLERGSQARPGRPPLD